jgi:hypothetical protein
MKRKALSLTLSAITILALVGTACGQVPRPMQPGVPGNWGAVCETPWNGSHWQSCTSRPCEATGSMPATFCVSAPRAAMQCGLRRGELWRSGDTAPLAWHDCWSSDQCCYTYNFVVQAGRSYYVRAQSDSPFHECGPTKSRLRSGSFQCTPN